MCKGRLVEFGKTNEVLYDPRHNYTKLLLNSIPKINKDRKAKTIKEVNLLDTDYSKKFEFLKDSTYINVSKDHFILLIKIKEKNGQNQSGNYRNGE